MAGTTGREVKRAALYVRVSTEDQAKEGYGLTVQRERCRAQVIAKGWTPAGEYADEGISGTKDTEGRPGLAALLEACEAGEVDAVVTLALDRLGRNTAIVLRLVERLNAAGVELVSCNEALDTSTPTGRFVLRMFASLAELDRDQIVAKTTAGRNARGAQDGERGGSVPVGYRRIFADGKATGVEVDPEGAELVRRVYDRRRQGAPLATIAAELNADGIATPRGHRWHASSVAVVLDNGDAYTGGTRGASDICWPAILTRRTVNAVAKVDRRRAA